MFEHTLCLDGSVVACYITRLVCIMMLEVSSLLLMHQHGWLIKPSVQLFGDIFAKARNQDGKHKLYNDGSCQARHVRIVLGSSRYEWLYFHL